METNSPVSHFGIDYQGALIAAVLTLIFFLLYYYFKQNRNLQLVFSSASLFLNKKRTFKERFSNLPIYLLFASLILLLIALVGPHMLMKTEPGSEEQESRGLAIFLLLDNSTSMLYKVIAKSETGALEEIQKMDLSKRVAKQFIIGDKTIGLSGRKGDVIGLVAFARIARIISPLTLDHAKVINDIDKIQYNRDIKQVGTGIGYAIFKTVSTIKATTHFSQDKEGTNPSYEIKNPVIIVVTDGINEVNPDDKNNPLRSMDLWRAAEFAKENNVKLYIVNIDPSFANPKFKDYNELYRLITRYTGGNFFGVDDKKDIQEIYRDIDRVEKSKIPLFAKIDKEEDSPFFDKISLYPYFLSLGLFLISLSITLDAFFFKRTL